MPMHNPPHPGLTVRHDCLEPLGLTVTEGAKVLGVTRQALNNLVNGKAGISPEMAVRLFNEAIHALRMRVERTFAWEDKFKRLLLRFERIQQRHYGMKVLAYTLINLRKFCGT